MMWDIVGLCLWVHPLQCLACASTQPSQHAATSPATHLATQPRAPHWRPGGLAAYQRGRSTKLVSTHIAIVLMWWRAWLPLR
jgi:hypothetical protein